MLGIIKAPGAKEPSKGDGRVCSDGTGVIFSRSSRCGNATSMGGGGGEAASARDGIRLFIQNPGSIGSVFCWIRGYAVKTLEEPNSRLDDGGDGVVIASVGSPASVRTPAAVAWGFQREPRAIER